MTRQVSPSTIVRILISGSLLFYAMSGLASVLNYAVYPVLSRIMTVQHYGEVQFLLSIFNQLSFGFVVINILAIVIVASNRSDDHKTEILKSLNVIASCGAIIIALAGAATLLLFAETIKLTSLLSIALLGVALVLNVPFTIIVGQLQGEERFLKSGIVSLVATVSKFIFSIAFVYAGWGVAGAIAGVACGMALAIILGNIYAGKIARIEHLRLPTHLNLLAVIRQQAAAGVIAILFFTLLSGIDLIASRIVLSHEDAGLYAVIATIAKITIAACSPIVWLALPAATKRNRTTIWRYTFVGICICLVVLVPLLCAPVAVTTLAMSINPGALGILLSPLAISMCTYALSFITLTCLIAAGTVRSVYLSVAIALFIFLASITLPALLNHTPLSMTTIVYAQLYAGMSLLGLTAFYLLRHIPLTRV